MADLNANDADAAAIAVRRSYGHHRRGLTPTNPRGKQALPDTPDARRRNGMTKRSKSYRAAAEKITRTCTPPSRPMETGQGVPS